MNMKEIAEQAKSHLAEVTGLKPVSVTGTYRDDQGWHITVEMLELSRIPAATDVLGNYEVLLDDSGNMLRFQRKGTRHRGEPVEEKG